MIFTILKLIVVSLLSLWLLSKVNFFSFFSFIPETYVSEVGITTYFTVVSLFFDYLIECFKNKFQSELIAAIFVKDEEPSLNSIPKIVLNNDGLAEANINIKVNGRKKHFNDVKLLIPAYKFITMQVGQKSAMIDSEGNLIINLEEMFPNNNEKYSNEMTIRVTFIKESDFNTRDIELKPVIKKKMLFSRIKYSCNAARLIEKE